MSLQPYAVRLSTPAVKVLAGLPEHTEETVRDLLDTAAPAPWDPDDPEGDDVRIASAGRLSVIHFANRLLRHLSVLDIVRLNLPERPAALRAAGVLEGIAARVGLTTACPPKRWPRCSGPPAPRPSSCS
ncbi:hypothetical protein [Streptomyces nojiriensis]|uniref:hypothetical protein n=1 Tax=Streptomyces nojiriensis TaxID=66374 RepID=UPI0036565CA6